MHIGGRTSFNPIDELDLALSLMACISSPHKYGLEGEVEGSSFFGHMSFFSMQKTKIIVNSIVKFVLSLFDLLKPVSLAYL